MLLICFAVVAFKSEIYNLQFTTSFTVPISQKRMSQVGLAKKN